MTVRYLDQRRCLAASGRAFEHDPAAFVQDSPDKIETQHLVRILAVTFQTQSTQSYQEAGCHLPCPGGGDLGRCRADPGQPILDIRLDRSGQPKVRFKQRSVQRVHQGGDEVLPFHDREIVSEVPLDLRRPPLAAFIRYRVRRREDKFRNAGKIVLDPFGVAPDLINDRRRRTGKRFPLAFGRKGRFRDRIGAEIALALGRNEVRPVPRLARITARPWNFMPPSFDMRSFRALSMSVLSTATV